MFNAQTDSGCCNELRNESQYVFGQEIGQNPVQDDRIAQKAVALFVEDTVVTDMDLVSFVYRSVKITTC